MIYLSWPKTTTLLFSTLLLISTITCSSFSTHSPATKYCKKPNTDPKNKTWLDCIIDDEFINATLFRTSGSVLELRLRERTVRLLNVPDVMQATEYTCGPSSLSAVLAYNQYYYRESQLAILAKTSEEYGTGPRNLLAAIKSLNISAIMYEQMTISDLQNHINANRPVIVQIQAWSDDPVNYATDFEDGHYVVVIGYDDTYLYFQDPWIIGSIGYINKRQFADRWHDAVHSQSRKVFNLGIVVNIVTYNHPNVIRLQ